MGKSVKKSPKSVLDQFKDHPITRGDITKQVADALIAEFGKVYFAAQAIAPHAINSLGQPAPINTVRGWIQLARDSQMPPNRPSRRPGRLEEASRVVELLDAGRQDIGDIDIRSVRLSSYGQVIKNAKGEPETVKLHSTSFVGKPKELNASQYIKGTIPPIPPLRVARFAKPDRKGAQVGFVTGDWQTGYYRDPHTGELDPFHDESAFAAMLSVLRDVRPDFGVFNGDLADLAPLSRFPQYAGYYNTLDLGIRRVREQLAQVRVAVGADCDLTWSDGNHEQRLARMVLEKIPQLQDIIAPGTDIDLLGSRFVFELDKLKIAYNPPFPGEKMMLAPTLGVQHRLTGSKRVQFDSIIHGDDHKLYVKAITVHDSNGARYVYDASAGCLCRIENIGHAKPFRPLRSYVPSQAINHDWQQGFIVVTIHKDGRFQIEPVPIVKGTAYYRGAAYVGQMKKGRAA